MARSSKLGLTTLLLTGALAPLGAQDLKEAFQLLPPTTVSIEVYANPGHLEQRANKLSAKFKAKANPFMTQLPGLKLAPSVLGTGSTLLVELPSAQPNVKRQALIIPAENFPALVKRLKAVKTAGRYTITQGKAKFTLAARGTYAVLSGDAKLVEELKGGGPNLGEELAPIVPWIKSHDTVLLAPSSTMSKGLVALRSALAPKAGSPPTPSPRRSS